MNVHAFRLRRCDRCGAKPKYQVLTSSGLDLLLCGHHAYKHSDVLVADYPVLPIGAGQ